MTLHSILPPRSFSFDQETWDMTEMIDFLWFGCPSKHQLGNVMRCPSLKGLYVARQRSPVGHFDPNISGGCRFHQEDDYS
jgi:hypothetical protein